VLGAAFVANAVGLSLPLGAFLAGMVIGEAERVSPKGVLAEGRGFGLAVRIVVFRGRERHAAGPCSFWPRGLAVAEPRIAIPYRD
jgi:hypothetical protein